MSGRRSNVKVGLVLIAIAALLVLTAIGVWKLGTWIGFFLVYNWIFNQITSYGMNTYVARIASILLGCAVWFGAVYLWKKNRKWSVGVIVALIVLQSTFLFFAERNRYFSATTGEPTKYYTINPMTQEIQVFDREVYDAFGQKSQRVNFEIAQQIERQRATRHFPNEEIPPERIKNFYDFSSGQPLVYYSQDGQGRIHLYLRDGYDIKTGVQLQPVTATVVDQATVQNASSVVSPVLPAQDNSPPPTAPSLPQIVGTTISTTPPPPVGGLNEEQIRAIEPDEEVTMITLGVVIIVALVAIATFLAIRTFRAPATQAAPPARGGR